MYATRGTDWAQVGTVLAGAAPVWTVLVGLVSLGCHVLRAERWRVLLRPVGDVPRLRAISATLIGFGASMVLPLRLGEIVRPAFLARRTGIPMSPALSSIVLERLLDILFVIGCFLVVSFVYEVPEYLRRSAVGLGVVAAVGFMVLVLMQRRRATAERLVRSMLGVLPKRVDEILWPIIDGLLAGVAGVADPATLGRVLLYSLVLWSGITATYLLSFLALGVDVPLVAASLTTVVVVAAFVMLPQAPGFVGTWQAACVLALGLFGVPHDQAVGYSLLTWAVQMVVNIGSAAVSLAVEGVSVGDLVREERREASGA